MSLSAGPTITPRILHVISTNRGRGVQQQLQMLCSGLAASEFELHVVAIGPSDGPPASSPLGAVANLTYLRSRGQRDVSAWWKLDRCMRQLRPQLVHLWDDHAIARAAAFTAGAPRLLMSQRSLRPNSTAHSPWLQTAKTRGRVHIVANSHAAARFCLASGWSSEQVSLIENAVQLQRQGSTEPAALDRAALAREFDLSSDAKIIAAAGTFVRQKRFKDLFWGIDQLSVVRDDGYLLLVGAGPAERLLRRYARLYNPGGRVRFVGERDDLSRWLPQVDVFWHAARCESTSNSLLEAMALGVPVVASQSPANDELIVHGQTGYLASPAVRSDFARWTQRLLTEPFEARRLAANAQACVTERYRPDRMVVGYRDLYARLLSS